MSDKDHIEWWDDRVEAYVDGVLPGDESEELESLLDQDSLLSAEVAMAERIRSEFKVMASVTCPESVTSDIKKAIRRDVRQMAVDRWMEQVQSILGGYRKYALAALLLVAITVVLTRNPGLAPEENIPLASVEQALDDVKWTLAMLSDAGTNAAGTVRNDVVEPVLIDRLGGTLDVLKETQN